MDKGKIGKILCYYRKKYNFKQEDICAGICSLSTYSRLEKGIRKVDWFMIQLLLERMGEDEDSFEIILYGEDYRLWDIRNKISEKIGLQNGEEVKKLINHYRKLMPQDERIHEQYCLYSEIRIDKIKNANPEKRKEKLLKAIQITRPQYEKEAAPGKRLYTKMEIEMILAYAEESGKLNLEEKEISQILRFIDDYCSQQQREEIIVPVLLKVIRSDKNEINDDKRISYANKGIEIIAKGQEIKNLGDFYFEKVKAMERKYRNSQEWESKKADCYEECKMAYYLFLTEHKEKQQKEVQQFCKGVFGCQITE